MDIQLQQQINQLKVIALQSAQGDIIKATDIFNWLSLDYEADLRAKWEAAASAN